MHVFAPSALAPSALHRLAHAARALQPSSGSFAGMGSGQGKAALYEAL